VLALFDLDGTITRHDTLLLYLVGFLRQQPGRLLRVPQALPPLGRFALGRADRGELKAAWIRVVLGGTTRAEPQLIGNGLIADARAAIEAHRRAGDYLVLLSASPDLYVPAIGRALGFDEVLCTGVEWNGDHLSGRLTTPNRRGAEKARCLEALRQRHAALPIVAYGNAAGDLEHLALADRALLVNGSAHARRAAARLGVDSVTWH
jgi:phosphatidylglycerophosphatase C